MLITPWPSTKGAPNFPPRCGLRRFQRWPGKQWSRSGSAAYIATLAAVIRPIPTAPLSDLTLGWMMSKASALGLVFVPAVAAQYALPMDPKYALDQKHESWNPLWVFPKRRLIAPESTLSDSVFVRCQNDSSYRPGNVTFVNGAPDPGYAKASVVSQAAMAAAD